MEDDLVNVHQSNRDASSSLKSKSSQQKSNKRSSGGGGGKFRAHLNKVPIENEDTEKITVQETSELENN